MHVARVYLRVSTQGQDLDRQESIIAEARDAGYYIAGVYREKASGARADRPELLRLIADLPPGEVVVAEKIDRISRLPLPEAEKLIETIRNKGDLLRPLHAAGERQHRQCQECSEPHRVITRQLPAALGKKSC
jgi:DNA invertase Pin-like site-specific DNA recombinase